MDLQMMKKLTMMMAAAVAAAMPLMADTEYANGYTWTYRINGDTAEIYNDGYCAIAPEPTGAVTIPSTLGGKTVTSIGESVFIGCSELTSVAIPDSVTSIGGYAFEGCEKLTSVTIPDSVTVIMEGAFMGCNGLTDVVLSANLKVLGVLGRTPDFVSDGVFSGCSGLKSIVIPDSVTSIGQETFWGCDGLTSVTIPNSVEYIGERAFSDCSGLASVTIPDSVTYIGSEAFAWCDSLRNVELPLHFKTNPSAFEGAFEDDVLITYRTTATYKVTFNANGGSVSPTTRSVEWGATVGALPTPTRNGYTFDGWYTKKSGGTKVSAKTKVTKNITYYAQWTAKKYAVTLKKSGKGTVSGGGKKAYNSTVTLKAKASKGCVFKGWYDADGNLVSGKATWKIKVPLGGVTYTARFEKKTATKKVAARTAVVPYQGAVA